MWPGLSVPLPGELVTLVPLSREHEQPLFDASSDPEIWQWLTGFVPNREEFSAQHERNVIDSEEGRIAAFATVWHRTGTAIGSTRYTTLHPEHRRLEVGSWLARSAWKTGVNVEAKLLMLEHAFERMGCQRVEFKCDTRNTRARCALAALPAQFEGILRQHMVTPSGARDSAYYSVVADEWPEVRGQLEHRRSIALGCQVERINL
jgi:N-acetyltransferase